MEILHLVFQLVKLVCNLDYDYFYQCNLPISHTKLFLLFNGTQKDPLGPPLPPVPINVCVYVSQFWKFYLIFLIYLLDNFSKSVNIHYINKYKFIYCKSFFLNRHIPVKNY